MGRLFLLINPVMALKSSQHTEFMERDFSEICEHLDGLHRLYWLLTGFTQMVLSKMNLKNFYGSLKKL